MPHVCIVACQHSPDDVRVTHRVAASFREAGFRVSWVGPGPAVCPPGADGIEFYFYRRLRGRVGRLLHHLGALWAASGVRDVHVYYAVEPDSAAVALALGRRRGAAVIFDIHEVFHDDLLSGWVAGAARRLVASVVLRGIRALCQRVDLVVAVSQTVLDCYAPVRVPSLVVHNFARAGLAWGGPAGVLPPDRSEVVAMHGWGGPHRGDEVVLQAAREASRRLDRTVQAIVFEDPEECRQGRSAIRAAARRLDAEANLDLRIPVSFADMPRVLRGCDMGLLAYSRVFGVNGLPNRLFEYMALGLPVIAPAYGTEIARVVEKAGCGLLVDCEDPGQLAASMVWLVRNPEEARRMGLNGRAAFLEHYNWEREVHPLVEWVSHAAVSRT